MADQLLDDASQEKRDAMSTPKPRCPDHPTSGVLRWREGAPWRCATCDRPTPAPTTEHQLHACESCTATEARAIAAESRALALETALVALEHAASMAEGWMGVLARTSLANAVMTVRRGLKNALSDARALLAKDGTP